MVFALAFLISGIFPGNVSKAYASANIDISRKGSLTVTHYSVDDEIIPGVTSHIYLVATIDENGQYTITEDFKDCFSLPIELHLLLTTTSLS